MAYYPPRFVAASGCWGLTSFDPSHPDALSPGGELDSRAPMDYEVQRFTRRCAATDREFTPGETFYSVLMAEGAAVVRHDYAAEAWPGPPAEALGWWKSQLPGADAKPKKPQWAPSDVMLQLFDELAERPEQIDLRYVLALLLLRRRVLRLEDTEPDASGNETMLLYCPRRETDYRVTVNVPDAARTEQIQQELARLLVNQAA